MYIKRFKHFCAYIRTNSRIQALVTCVKLFRIHEAKWYDEENTIVDDKVLCTQLGKCDEIFDPYWRENKSSVAFIYVASYMAVVRVNFAKPPKNSSLKNFKTLLEEVGGHAHNEFSSIHDSLTGLLNKHGFLAKARELANFAATHKSNEADSPSVESSAMTMAILAMDIDHFKQVNDTFGHMYGDVVIQCLAKRLEEQAEILMVESKGKLQIHAARPSGEEFLMLLSGRLDTETLKAHADRVRISISTKALPSDEEWSALSPQNSETTFPSETDRRITISIGATSMPMPAPTDIEFDRAVDAALHKADLAMYIAKFGGRDVVRHFSEILSRHGHVLQHHPETNIVAIDLGRQVGCPLGQEFNVIHPAYDGRTSYMQNDGRTNKKRGLYPKILIGRIVVFDLQQDISFCTVANQTCQCLFPVGSHLESIPIGSISHLVSSTSFGGIAPILNLTPADQLTKVIASITREESVPLVASFSIDNVETLIKDRGTAFINEALAKLYESLTELLPVGSHLGLIQDTEFAAIAYILPAKALDFARQIITLASEKCNKHATFSAGLFVDPLPEVPPIKGDRSELRPEYAMEYARYALSDAKNKGNYSGIFTPDTAAQIMFSSLNKQLWQQGIEDYKTFKKLGINYFKVESYGAGCAMRSRDESTRELSREAGLRAIEFLPNHPILYSNLGIYEFRLNNPRAAFTAFKKAYAIAPDFKADPHVLRLIAMSNYAEYTAGGPVEPDELLKMLQAVQSQSDSYYGIMPSQIELAIADVMRGKKKVDNVPNDCKADIGPVEKIKLGAQFGE